MKYGNTLLLTTTALLGDDKEVTLLRLGFPDCGIGRVMSPPPHSAVAR